MTPAEIREYVRTRCIPCPCCGGAVMLVSTGQEIADALQRVLEVAARTGERLVMVTAEEAEADLRKHGGDYVTGIGVKVRE
jgi:hypothetical protein